MGHAVHFLERLERLDRRHLDEALALYRDPRLVRGIAGMAQADRVALDLSPEGGGPYVVLARDGGFVTCLARGMSTGELAVMPRARLEGLTGFFQRFGEGIAKVREAGGVEKTSARLRRLHGERAHLLTREEFGELEAVLGLHLLDHTEICLGVRSELTKSRKVILDSIPRKLRTPGPTQHQAMVAYWKRFYAFQHSGVLAASDAGAISVVLGDETRQVFDNVAARIFQQRIIGPLLRAMWVAARAGPWLHELHLDDLAQLNTIWDAFDATVCLTAIAGYHLPARGPILERFDAMARDESTTVASYKGSLATLGATMLRYPEEARARFFARARHVWDGNPGYDAAAEDLSEEDVFSLMCCIPLPVNHVEGSFVPMHGVQELLFAAAPWIGDMPARALYPRAELLRQDVSTRDFEAPAIDLFRSAAEARARPAPVRREKRPGRNEACPCGSGKKYKRCCLRAA